MNHRTTPVRVRLRIVATLEAEYEETEPPSLPGITIDAPAEEATGVRDAPLAKTSADYFPFARRAGGER
jgi:hypothetical protein